VGTALSKGGRAGEGWKLKTTFHITMRGVLRSEFLPSNLKVNKKDQPRVTFEHVLNTSGSQISFTSSRASSSISLRLADCVNVM